MNPRARQWQWTLPATEEENNEMLLRGPVSFTIERGPHMSEVSPEEHDTVTEPAPEVAPDPSNPRIEEAPPMLVHENEPPAPGPDASILDALRLTAHFEYLHLGDILADLVTDTGIVLFTEPGPIISPIYFEDEPLRLCLDRLAYLVGGSYEYAPVQGLHFKVS